MMQNYSNPCYTLQEAKEILNLRESKLLHAIRSNCLSAVLYTKSRNMLLFLRNEDKTWEGLATCIYRGHISAPLSVIATLLDEATYHIGRGSVTLLEPTGISNWSIAYPFKRFLPHLPIIEWKPIDQSVAIAQSQGIAQLKQHWPIGQTRPIGQTDVPLYACAATPLPIEFEPANIRQKNLVDEYNEAIKAIASGSFKTLNLNKIDIEHLELNFHTNSEFKREDLRIPASEIARYKTQLAEQDKANKIAEVVTPLTTDTQRKRDSQLHDLIERIIEQKPSISAKDTPGVLSKRILSLMIHSSTSIIFWKKWMRIASNGQVEMEVINP